MAGGEGHKVSAPLIVVRVPGAAGGETYFRRGQLLPSSVSKTERERLVELGLVVATDEVYVDPARVSPEEEAARAAETEAAAKAAAEQAEADRVAAEKAAAEAAAEAEAKAAAKAAESTADVKPQTVRRGAGGKA